MADKFRKELRERIQKNVDQAQDQRQKELFRKRLELARSAMTAFAQKKPGEAVRSFFTYIKILEEWKKVPEGGLTPSHFDQKTDIPELILITGIYWDLAKMFDRTKSPDRYKDFQHFLDKYVVFSKGTPYEKVSAETLRKYLSHNKPIHTREFKNAYKLLVPSRCFIVAELGPLVGNVDRERLRTFRDGVLKRSSLGRSLVAHYYRRGPHWAEQIHAWPESRRQKLAWLVQQIAGLAAQTARVANVSETKPSVIKKLTHPTRSE